MPQRLPLNRHFLTERAFHLEFHAAHVITVLEADDRGLNHVGAYVRFNTGHASRGEVVQFNRRHTVLPQCT